ncbi:hypothetical protein PENANT_c003G05838 [Penicillium antarcticum]|uniref:Transcription factor domain-containing protein n=1 Tax=Penicillium antarcticum TaxID=416450 RepID=A0A1V6QIP0_9EURO|nr:hypothetical protein PENANT_c003G05838 [Penicillium antarcticum]
MSEKGDQLLDDHPQLAEFLACSFMLISFEVFRGAEHDWLLHLDATASLMGLLSPEAIFNSDSTICDLSSIPLSEQYRSPKSGMVEGLQFLTVAVIWSDIFACVATGRAPRLPYQQWLRIQGLNTADLMGCENWVMVVIGDLAHLSIWKEKQEEEGMLSIRELASRGKEIERCLEGGIQDLDLARCAHPGVESSTNWVSRLFAYAALVLLHTIVSGPLPALPEIQSAVSRAIGTLQNRPQGYSLTGVGFQSGCSNQDMTVAATVCFYQLSLLVNNAMVLSLY